MLPAAAGAQLARGVVAHEAELVDRGTHALDGRFGDTVRDRLSTFETVPTETPARAATSRTLTPSGAPFWVL